MRAAAEVSGVEPNLARTQLGTISGNIDGVVVAARREYLAYTVEAGVDDEERSGHMPGVVIVMPRDERYIGVP